MVAKSPGGCGVPRPCRFTHSRRPGSGSVCPSFQLASAASLISSSHTYRPLTVRPPTTTASNPPGDPPRRVPLQWIHIACHVAGKLLGGPPWPPAACCSFPLPGRPGCRGPRVAATTTCMYILPGSAGLHRVMAPSSPRGGAALLALAVVALVPRAARSVPLKVTAYTCQDSIDAFKTLSRQIANATKPQAQSMILTFACNGGRHAPVAPARRPPAPTRHGDRAARHQRCGARHAAAPQHTALPFSQLQRRALTAGTFDGCGTSFLAYSPPALPKQPKITITMQPESECRKGDARPLLTADSASVSMFTIISSDVGGAHPPTGPSGCACLLRACARRSKQTRGGPQGGSPPFLPPRHAQPPPGAWSTRHTSAVACSPLQFADWRVPDGHHREGPVF